MVSLVHPERVDIIEGWESFEVLCVSQNLRSISYPTVDEKICMVVDSKVEGSLKIKEALLDDYMVIYYNHMMLICFEAY